MYIVKASYLGKYIRNNKTKIEEIRVADHGFINYLGAILKGFI